MKRGWGEGIEGHNHNRERKNKRKKRKHCKKRRKDWIILTKDEIKIAE